MEKKKKYEDMNRYDDMNRNETSVVEIEGECIISNTKIHFITNIKKLEYSMFCRMDMVIYDKEHKQYIRLQNADVLRIIKDNYEEI